MSVKRNQLRVAAAEGGFAEAVVPELHVVGPDAFAAEMRDFLSPDAMPVSRQREIMTGFWNKLGLVVPEVAAPSTELEHTIDEMRATSRLIAFPLLPDLRDYQAIAETARQKLPRHGYNPKYHPLIIEDNDDGLFPKFVADPGATILTADGQSYVQRYMTPAGELVEWDEYITWLEKHGHALKGPGGTSWGFLGRDMVDGGPAGLAITMNLLQHANGTPPQQHGMVETNAAIYALDAGGAVDARPVRSVDAYWHDKKGQFRVISSEPMYGSPREREREVDSARHNFIGQTLSGRLPTD